MEKIKVIVDTDIGSDIDDALCLAYLLNEPRCEILGITTSSSEPHKRAEIADSICRAAKKCIPIFPGRYEPLRTRQRQVAVHQYSVTEKLPHATYSSECRAVDFMKSMIEKYPGEVVLLAIGPLTNIGALLAEYPHLAASVKLVSLMGGSFFEEGRSYTRREWNILCDPYAADILFQSGAKILVAGLDVTLKTKRSVKAFLEEKHSEIMKTVSTYAEKFAERTDDMYYHDVVAAMMLFEDSVVKTRTGKISVAQGAELGRCDFHEYADGNARVAYDLDVDKFFRIYDATVNIH